MEFFIIIFKTKAEPGVYVLWATIRTRSLGAANEDFFILLKYEILHNNI